jgi:hypothetical protein
MTRGERRKFQTPKEFHDAAEAYFASCEPKALRDVNGAQRLDKMGQPVYTPGTPLTRAGLAVAMGFKSRSSLDSYKKNPLFAEEVGWCELVVEAYNMQQLYTRDGNRGAEFMARCVYGIREPDAHAQETGNGALEKIEVWLRRGGANQLEAGNVPEID